MQIYGNLIRILKNVSKIKVCNTFRQSTVKSLLKLSKIILILTVLNLLKLAKICQRI